MIGATAVAAAAALGTGVASAGSDDATTEHPITGEVRARAEAVAVAFTHGGTVTGTEEGDEESLYEIEVTRADGSQVDVQLDGALTVVGSKVDGDTSTDGP